MQDRELYRQILGLTAPWEVSRVELKMTEGRVDIWVGHDAGVRWPCPECGTEFACRDHAEERTWRHLDTCQLKTFLHGRVPRVDCPTHGVRQAKVPWAEAHSRFTLLMERLVIDVLTQCSTVSGACRLMRLSWDEAWGVMDRAVSRGLSRKQRRELAAVGVDEKAFRKGHRYMTLVYDLEGSGVEYVGEERTAAALEAYWNTLTEAQRGAIRAVAMDMWAPYIQATIKCLPDAHEKIVFDRFHIMSHMLKAVDTVRKQESRTLAAEGKDTLKGTKYCWLFSRENLPERHQPKFDALMDMNLKVGRAWAIKESLRELWRYHSIGWARRFFSRWYFWATHSRLAPVIKVARTIKEHLKNVLTYCRHRVTNAVAEGINSKIMAVVRKACGFRNAEHFKTAIYFYCGNLDLYPR